MPEPDKRTTRHAVSWLPIGVGLGVAALALWGLVRAIPIATAPERIEQPSQAVVSDADAVSRIAYYRDHAHEHLARIRPVIADIIGGPVDGEIPIILADRTEWAAGIASRSLHREPGEGTVQTSPYAWLDLRDQIVWERAPFVGGSVPPSGDAIWLLAGNLCGQELDGSWDALDAVLAHELVHVHQFRSLGFAGYLEDAQNDEERLVRRAVIEGHAEWVTRQAAKRIGCELGFERLSRPRAESAPQEPFELWRAALLADFRYREGERFVRAVFERLGPARGLKHLRRAPPRTVWEVVEPDRYLSAADVDVKSIEIPEPVRTLFEYSDLEPAVIQTPIVEAALRPIGRTGARVAVSELIGTRRSSVTARFGASDAPEGHLLLSRFSSKRGARRFLAKFTATWTLPGATGPAIEASQSIQAGSISVQRFGPHEAVVAQLRMIDRVPLDPIDTWAIACRTGTDVVVCNLAGVRPNDPALALFTEVFVATVMGDADVTAPLAAANDGFVTVSAEDLLQFATDGPPTVRWAALAAADAVGDLHRWSMDERRGVLYDEHAQVRALATRTILRRLDVEDATRIGLPRLLDEDPGVRAESVGALARHAERDERIERRLAALIDDPSAAVRRAVLDALGEKLDIDARVAALRDPDDRVRRRAVTAMGVREQSEIAPEALRDATQDTSAAVRTEAWLRLASDAYAQRLERADVVQAMTDPSRGVQAGMLRALRVDERTRPFRSLYRQVRAMQAGKPAQADQDAPTTEASGADLLAAAFETSWAEADPALRARLLAGAGSLDEDRGRFRAFAREALDDPQLWPFAVPALGSTSATEEDVDRLVTMIRSGRARAAAAQALGAMRAVAASAKPVLRDLLASHHAGTRHAALKALLAIGGPRRELGAIIARDLADNDPATRFLALRSLLSMYGEDKTSGTVRAAMSVALRDPHAWVRGEAVSNYDWNAESLPTAAVEQLGSCLVDDSAWVRKRARTVFKFVRLEPGPMLPYARRGLTAPDRETRELCVFFLATHDELGPDLVPVLIEAFSSDDALTRSRALRYLAQLAQSMPELRPELVVALDDRSESVRGEAVAFFLTARPLPAPTLRLMLAALDARAQEAAESNIVARLESVDSDVAPILPVIAKLLDGGRGALQLACCDALLRLGYAPAAVRPGLERLAQSAKVPAAGRARAALALPETAD